MTHHESEAAPRPQASPRLHRPPDAHEAERLARETQLKALGAELYGLAERVDTRRTGRSHYLPLTAITASWLTGLHTDRTRTAYRRDITRWFAWCADRSISPARATEHHYRDYDLWLREQVPHPRSPGKHTDRYAKSSRTRYLSAVSSFYTAAEDADEIITNPSAGTSRQMPRNRLRRLTAPEQDALWTAVTTGWPDGYLDGLTLAAVVALGLDQAWRPGQMYAARVQDLEPVPGGVLAITTTVRGVNRYTDELTDRACDAVTQLLINGRGYSSSILMASTIYPGYSAPLLTAKHNRPMGRGWLAYMLERAAQVAGIDPGTTPADRITPLILRRTALAPPA